MNSSGYRRLDEADRVREELDDARNDRIQKKLSEAVEMIESHFQSHEWDRAQGEIDRLVNALPDNSRVLSLQDRIKALKDQHKQELKAAWDDAVRRNDTDHAIDVLKELDVYLSPAEAQSLQTSISLPPICDDHAASGDVLADEPTGNLDTKTGKIVLETFQRLHQKQGHTIVLITHEPYVAEHAERIIHIRDGSIVEDGKVNNRRAANHG